MAPIVSIIIPVYNRPVLVAEAIESVLAQSNPNWELIVVDDDSTDNTWEVLEGYAAKDERIRVFKRDREPKGANRCRNMGAELATSDYLVFLDSDDLIGETFVETRKKYIKEFPELDFIVFPQIGFEESPQKGVFPFRELFGKEDDLTRFLKIDLPWLTTGPIWRKESFFRLGAFDERLQSNQEWDLNIRAILSWLKYQKIGGLVKSDIFFRKNLGLDSISNAKTISRTFLNKEVAINNFLEINDSPSFFKKSEIHKAALIRLCLQISLPLAKSEQSPSKHFLWESLHNKGIISSWEKKYLLFYMRRIVQNNQLLKRGIESFVYRLFPKSYYL